MENIPLKWNGCQIGVYCIRNKVNSKVYVGSSKNCYHRVKSQHFARLRAGSHSNPHFQSAWDKYGEDSFESFCLEICSYDELSRLEQGWFKKMRCLDRKFGYNINPFADRIEHTDEQKMKISFSLVGKPRRPGLPSGITRLQYKGKVTWSVEIIFRHKRYYLGKFESLQIASEVREKSLSRILDGQKPDIEWINTLRKTHYTPVLQIKQNEIVNEFVSIKVAARGFDVSKIKDCCNGIRKTHGGYVWRYKTSSKKSCAFCKIEFWTTRKDQKYCNAKCRDLGKDSKVGLICQNCGDQYRKRKSSVSTSKYCSNPCKYEGRSKC